MRNKASGFTLIEILVVVVIVGIMAGIVLLSAPSFLSFADMEGESKRIKLLLNMLRDEAVIQGREFGFKPEADGYTFYYYDEQHQSWNTLEADPFKAYRIAEGISLYLEVENQKVSADSPKKKEIPPVLVFSSGELTPFELQISEEGSERLKVLISNGYADLAWQASQE